MRLKQGCFSIADPSNTWIREPICARFCYRICVTAKDATPPQCLLTASISISQAGVIKGVGGLVFFQFQFSHILPSNIKQLRIFSVCTHYLI